MNLTNLMIFVIFAIGCFATSVFVSTGNKNATKCISVLSAFLFAIVASSLLGHYFVLNDYSFNVGYFEARKNNPVLFGEYLFFIRITALVVFLLPIIARLFVSKLQGNPARS